MPDKNYLLEGFPLNNLFWQTFNCYPSYFRIENVSKDFLSQLPSGFTLIHANRDLLDEKEKEKENDFEHKLRSIFSDYEGDTLYYHVENPLYNECFVIISISNDSIMVTIYHRAEGNINPLVELIKPFVIKESGAYINLLNFTQGFYTTKHKVNDFDDLDIALNYGERFIPVYEKINKELEKKGASLILLHGAAGGGKSTFLRHLLGQHTDKNVIYLPSNLAHTLGEPSFIPFLCTQKNAVLFIEDAEGALKSRESGENQAVSNILNLSDGLLSDIFGIKIVATFNTSVESLDSALIRKGRCKIMHDFKKLSVEDANKLLKHLDLPATRTEMTLAEIYNLNEDNGVAKKQERQMGFGV